MRKGRVAGAIRALTSTTLVAALMAVTSSAVSAAPANVQFFVQFGDCVIYGHAPNHKNVKVEWRSSDNSLKHVQTVLSSAATGDFQTTCDRYDWVEPGDVLKATIVGSTATPRSFTLPALTLEIDRVANTIDGTGALNSELFVQVLHYPGFGSAAETDYLANTDGTGAFPQIDTDTTTPDTGPTPVDIIGWDDVYSTWQSAKHDFVTLFQAVPMIRVWVDRPGVNAYGRPGTGFAAILNETPGNGLRASIDDTLDLFGGGGGPWFDTDAHVVRARIANEVDAHDFASDMVWTIPTVTVAGVASTDRVSGHCQPNHAWELDVFAPGGTPSKFKTGIAPGSGNFSFDFTPMIDVRSGYKVQVYCKLDTGDVVARQATVP